MPKKLRRVILKGNPAVVQQGNKTIFIGLSIEDEIMLRQAVPSQEKIRNAIQKLRGKGIGSDLGNDFSKWGTKTDCGPACEECCGMCETCNVWDDGKKGCVKTCRIHCCC